MNQYGKEILNTLGLDQEEVITAYSGNLCLRRPRESKPFAKVSVNFEKVRVSFGEIESDSPVKVVY